MTRGQKREGGGKEQQKGELVFICQVMTASGPRTNEPKQLYLQEHRLCPLLGLYCGCIGSRWIRDRHLLCPFVRFILWLYWVSLETRQTATVSVCSVYALAVLHLAGNETELRIDTRMSRDINSLVSLNTCSFVNGTKSAWQL
jgi:hypothetical protein